MLAPIQVTPGSQAMRTGQAQMTMIGHVIPTCNLSILTWTLATTAAATTAARLAVRNGQH